MRSDTKSATKINVLREFSMGETRYIILLAHALLYTLFKLVNRAHDANANQKPALGRIKLFRRLQVKQQLTRI